MVTGNGVPESSRRSRRVKSADSPLTNLEEDSLNTANSWKKGNLFHTLAALVTMSAFLFLVAAPRAQADERDRCRHRIEKAEVRLSYAVAKFGERSPEAR